MIKYRGLNKDQRGSLTGVDTLNPQIKKLSNRMQSGNVRHPNKLQGRLKDLRGQRNTLVNEQFQKGDDGTIGAKPAPLPDGLENIHSGPYKPGEGQTPGNSFMGMRDILFPGQRNFEQKDFEGSEIYKFRRDEALSDADKYASSRGLIGSGAEIAMRDKALSRVSAEEGDRASLIAQKDADRYYGMVRDEADFRDRSSNEAFDRQYQLMQLAAQQNPLDVIYGGAQNWGNYVNNIGKNKAKFQSENYARPTMSAGGYSGGASLPPFMAPYPGSPNTSNIDAIQNSYGGSFWNDLFSSVGGLIK